MFYFIVPNRSFVCITQLGFPIRTSSEIERRRRNFYDPCVCVKRSRWRSRKSPGRRGFGEIATFAKVTQEFDPTPKLCGHASGRAAFFSLSFLWRRVNLLFFFRCELLTECQGFFSLFPSAQLSNRQIHFLIMASAHRPVRGGLKRWCF